MKVRSAVRKMCKDCYLVKRKGKLFCYCKTDPRHKQRQGLHSISNHFTPAFSSVSTTVSPALFTFISPTSPPLAMVANSCSHNSFLPLRFGFGASSFFVRGMF
jgi:ribosomal protein L36